jgi:hypothetical protein
MEHYKRLTTQQLSMLAACAMLVGGMLLPRSTIVGACVLLAAVAFGIGALRKSRAS